jgi:DNA-binding NarL/FixJ family response regulator
MYFSPDVREIIHASPRIEKKKDLTERELDVIRAVLRSPDVERADLAPTMGIAPSTLHKHIHSLFAKMEVSTMVACVLKAMRMGLVDDPFQQ